MRYRIEKDDLGELHVPAEAYYGIHTLRSKQNFEISKRPISRQMIKALALVKKAAAKANYDAGLIDKLVSEAICLACDEILNGRLHGQFVTDLIQGGAGTSMNMNANEVIANRANEMMGSEKGIYDRVHPINHVNLCQSANDVVPTAGKMATFRLTKKLLTELKKLSNAFYDKQNEFEDILTVGKTHLLDSVPMTYGQLFGALGNTVDRDIKRIEQTMTQLLEVNLGGTVIGTGLNAQEVYQKKVVKYIATLSGEAFYPSKCLIDTTRNLDSFKMMSSAILTLALNINKMANDFKILSALFQQLELPTVQPGSSISPGKINPVISEMVSQVVLYMQGNDLTISLAVGSGELELNVNLPIILACLFENINFIRRAVRAMRESMVEGIKVVDDKEAVSKRIAQLITPFVPVLGYVACQDIAKSAQHKKKSIVDVIVEEGYLTRDEVDSYLDKEKLIHPGWINQEKKG